MYISVLRDIANKIREWARILTGKEYRVCQKRKISDSTMEVIISIVEGSSTAERERRFRTIGKITDILQTSKTEEEFLKALRAEYPEQIR